jgi:membrane protease YdiL (CAAX protease family)
MNLFLDSRRRLRSGWWIVIFFAVMASMLVPLLVVMRRRGGDVPLGAQFVVVAIASSVCQLLRRRPMAELIGRIDRRWAAQLFRGCGIGAALMLIPAGFLFVSGSVSWTFSGASLTSIIASVSLVAAVAATEELLFRGFVFQRLVDGAGAAVAQIIIAAYFVLTHSAALTTAGEVRWLAAANIFVASLLFGLAFLRTKRLALPLGLHFGANLTQGTILGFGVSGSDQLRLLVPHRGGSPDWLTGGAFGLEGSLTGLIVIIAACCLASPSSVRAVRSRCSPRPG